MTSRSFKVSLKNLVDQCVDFYVQNAYNSYTSTFVSIFPGVLPRVPVKRGREGRKRKERGREGKEGRAWWEGRRKEGKGRKGTEGEEEERPAILISGYATVTSRRLIITRSFKVK